MVGALNLPEDTGRLLLAVTGLMLLVTALHGISGTLLQSLQRFRALALTQMVNVGLTVIGVGALFFMRRLSIWSALLVVGVFSTLAAAGLEFLWLPPDWRQGLLSRVRERMTEARSLLRFGRWLWLSGALSILSAQLDLLLLNRWASPVEVGYYALAFNLSFKAHVVNKTMYTVLLPAASSLQDAASFRSFLRSSLARSMLWGALMVLALPFARPFIQVVYGSEYAPSVGVFYLLMAFVLLDLLALPLFLLPFSMKQPGLVAASDAVRVITLVAAGALLIPVWGMYGAAAAKLVSIAAGALVTGIAVTAALRKLP